MHSSIFSRKPDLISVFTSDRHIRCVFLTLVARVDAVMEKYPGGLKALAGAHAVNCNRELVVKHAMDTADLDPLADDLEAHGLEPGQDFVCFDFTSDAMICGDGARVEVCGWLTGITSGNATHVRCTN